MDYKTKYEQALAKAKNMIDDLRKGEDILAVSELESMFPELAKSDEERIMKGIKSIIEHYKEDGEVVCPYPFVSLDEALAWLEKQGEKKSFDYKNQDTQNGHKFNIGDIISNGNVEFRIDNIVKNYIGQDCYFLVNIKSEKNGMRYFTIRDSEGNTHYAGETTWLCEQVDAKFEKQEEQKTIDYAEELKKCRENPLYFFDKYVKIKIKEQKPVWGEEDMSKVQRICMYLNEAKKYYANINEVRECMDWLKSLKNRVLPQPKQEWSEEDECYMGECISAIATKDGWSFEEKRKTTHWLKSLKQRIGG